MTKRTLRTEFEPGRGYTREDWDEAVDDTESTDEELAQARPFAEVFPEITEAIRAAREAAGVVFLPENGNGPGVALRKGE